MSERTPSARRVATRIVPIRRLETAPAARRIAAELVTAPAARTRPAARLANSARFYRPSSYFPAADPGDEAVGPVHADATREGMSTGAGEIFVLREEHDDPALLVIWDRTPGPPQDVPLEVPRWVSNAELMPDEAEFTALGQYLVSMIDGFANFCRAPGVSDTGNWQARLPMPVTVLPETVLDINLSPVHARLHFETEHPVSRALLQRWIDTLRSQVREALEDTREVEVALW